MRRRLRLAGLVAAHGVDLVLQDGARGWLRGLRAAGPALGTLFAVLLLAGLGLMAADAGGHALAGEVRQAAVVRVYLRPDVAQEDADRLRERLRADRRVASVVSVSADTALAEATERPGLARLAEAAGDNPFPARLEVRATGLAEVAGIVAAAAGDPAVDPTTPTSYDAGAYADLQRFLGLAGRIALGAVVALALVAAAVTANAVRASVLARADDLATMRLLGARGWVLNGPFVVEASLTGALAGVLAAGVVLALFAGSQQAAVRTFTDVLPGVDWRAAGAAAGALPALGLAIGSLGALLGLRRAGVVR